MPRYELELSYSKIVEASDMDEATRMLEDIEYKSNLDDEYGPFSSTDSFGEVTLIGD